MKKFLLLAGVACLFSATANAGVSPYVSAKASYDFNKVKLKQAEKVDGQNVDSAMKRLNKNLVGTHVAAGVRAGYVRGELELNIPTRDVRRGNLFGDGEDSFKLYKRSAMANVYFDYLTCTPWTPYVGAGLGMSYLKAQMFDVDGKYFDKSTYTLAWQVMGGIAYEFNSHWAVDLGYRYADYGRIRKHESFGPDGDVITKITARDHEIMLGARYTF
jgi:opacity protein-like surface antigen